MSDRDKQVKKCPYCNKPITLHYKTELKQKVPGDSYDSSKTAMKRKQIIAMHFALGMSRPEIADELKLTYTHVESVIRDVKTSLKDYRWEKDR